MFPFSAFSFAELVVAAFGVLGLYWLLYGRRRAARRYADQVKLSQDLVYAQAAAQAAAARYQQLFDSSPLPMYVYDVESLAFLAVNEATIRHYGWSREEFLAMTIMDIRSESEREALRAVLNQFRVLGEWAPRREWTHLTKSGRPIVVEVSSGEIRMDGRAARLIVANDVTERRRAEAAALRSERAYHSLVDGLPYGIYRSTREGRFIMVNAALVAMLGYDSEDDLLGIDIEQDLYVHPEQRQRIVAAVTETGQALQVEVDWRRKDGTPLTVRLFGRPVKNAAGETEYFEVIAEDVTERRALEQQLRQAQKMEAVGQLAGGIAHDFNNLLTTILGTLDLMESGEAADARRADLSAIRRAAQHGADLTRKLLAFGRRQRLETRALELSDLATDFMVMARHVVPESVTLDFAIDSECTVLADAGAVEQILLNLLTNARDAVDAGGVVKVRIGRVALGDDRSAALGCRAGEYAELMVQDNGAGMDAETQGRMFEPFFTTKPVEKGSGLGLAMVYGLVKQHRGAIHVESEPGLGSIVRVFLPLAPVRAAERAAAPAAKRLTPLPATGRYPATILLVEDEEALRRVGERVLRRFGFEVVTAADGQQARELFRAAPGSFDLVVTDIVMPQLGGVALLEALRGIRPDIRILCTSGYPTRDTQLAGAWEDVPFLQKPWTMDALVAKVDEVLAAPAPVPRGQTPRRPG